MILIGGGLISLQRCSRCILQPQPTDQCYLFAAKMPLVRRLHFSTKFFSIFIFPSKTCPKKLEVLIYKEKMFRCNTYLPKPSARAGYDTRSIFKRCLTGLNSEFSFSSCLTKTEDPSRPYYLPIAGGRIIGFIPFPRVLVLCEMQSVSYRIWIRVAVRISYDVNHYTRGTYIVMVSKIDS